MLLLLLKKLLKKKETWVVVVILFLVGLLGQARLENRQLRAAIASRSAVKLKVEKKTEVKEAKEKEVKEVRGIIVTKEVTRTEPSGLVIVTKETIEQPVSTITVIKEAFNTVVKEDTEKQETPSCPKLAGSRPHRYFAGIMLDPADIEGPPIPRIGVNIMGRVDLGWSKTLDQSLLKGHRVDATWRFGR